MSAVLRLDRIVRICRAPLVLAAFYENALGFTCSGGRALMEPALAALLGVPHARGEVVNLRLGDQALDLLRIEPAGRAYPANVPGPDALFQHIAIEVSAFSRNLARLTSQSGWTPISNGGPQTLPPASGGVTAFKFRDPEGHPLELITPAPSEAQAAGSGISHSAICVEATLRSIAFYEQLGLARTGGSVNTGPEQDRLDGIHGAHVAVTALGAPDHPTPHLELLCYGEQFVRPQSRSQPNDIAADWLVFTVGNDTQLRQLLQQLRVNSEPVRFADGSLRSLLRDPDGHWLCLESTA